MSAPREYELDDGSTITVRELIDALGISFAAASARLRRSRDRERVFAKPKCLHSERTYTRDGVSFTATEVCARVPGLKYASAGVRGLAWERGELSTEQLLLPKRQYRGSKDSCDTKNKGSKEWQALSNKSRDHMLHRIPGVTPWERKRLERMGK